MILEQYREAAEDAEQRAVAAEAENAPNAARLRREADGLKRAYRLQRQAAEDTSE